MKRIFVLSFLAVTICLADPVQISVSGTSDSTALGYTSGQSYTFNWVINESYTGNPGDFFHTTYNQWHEQETSDSMMFSSLSGDGITGTYTQPSVASSSPNSYLITQSSSGLSVLAGSNSGTIGMQVNGIDLKYVQAFDLQIATFSNPSVYTDPTLYFSSYQGSYVPTGSGKIRLYTSTSQFHYFTPTEVNIDAIPEPATLAFVGIFGGGLWFVRRYFTNV